MKITELRIDRFGVWHDVTLPVRGAGLNVFYGPNEAGKSTLLRFLRGALYGFPGRSAAGELVDQAGALRVEHDGHAWELRRASAAEYSARGEATIHRIRNGAAGHALDAEHWLEDVQCGVSEDVYEKLFAIGLDEIQTLATLNGDEVSRRIYGASLGLEGQKLLAAMERCRARENELLASSDDDALPRLLEQESRIQRELTTLRELHDRRAVLASERADLEAEIDGCRSRQSDRERDLRGLSLMARAWEPWRQVDELRREMASLPDARSFPERGLERMREIESESESLRRSRTQHLAEAKALRKKAGGRARDDGFGAHRRTLWSLLDQRDAYQAASTRSSESSHAEAAARRELDARLAALGGEWSLARLEAIDAAPESQQQMVTLSGQYRQSLSRRNRMRKRLKGWSRSCRAATAEIAGQLKEIDATRLDDAISDTRERLADLEEFQTLHGELRQHEERRESLRSHSSRLATRLAYPEWLPLLLWFFAIGGIAAAVLGFWQGFHQNGIAGVMWVLLGATCGGLAFALRNHYDTAVIDTADHWTNHLHESETRARQSEQALEKLYRRSPWLRTLSVGWDKAASAAGPPSGACPRAEGGPALAKPSLSHPTGTLPNQPDECAQALRTRLRELERLADLQQKTARRRERLTGLRTKFQQAHRDVTGRRQEWCSLLRKVGLPDSSRVADTFRDWKNVAAAHDALKKWRSASAAAEENRKHRESFDQRVSLLGQQIDGASPANGPSMARLAAWEKKLEAGTQDTESARLLTEARRQRREAARCSRRLRELSSERRALLKAARCRTRPHFERKGNAFARRGELSELLEMAQADLAKVAADETELAIVDDDFRSFDPKSGQRRIATCREEIERTRHELAALHQRLGATSQELSSLEADTREAATQSALADVQARLKRRAEEWAALGHAREVLEQVRSRYERTSQPATLAAASEWLGRLTRGRYRNVWTPLGSRELRVDDERGQSLQVDQLSTGSREQLFLAVRMALIRDYQQKGVELPIVLDDVLVNFDQQRTEAALETLNDFANEGQQILLFTCHQHLAQLAESRRIEATRLPLREAIELPREERRAG